MKRYMLDTNTAGSIIKGDTPAVDHHLLAVGMEQLFISAVTEGELHYGVSLLAESVRLKNAVAGFLLRVTILSWDSVAAKHYGQLRASLRAGQPMGILDTMIAAHALANGLILVTNDQGFDRIKHLRIEDWTIPD